MMYPSKINWTSSRKKIGSHTLENLEHPDKKLNSLGIILIPWWNLKPIEKYQPSPSKKSQSTRKTSFIVKVSTTQKSLNHHEKASTPTLEIFLISPKILNPLCKFFNSLEVTSRTPLMRKSHFHLSRNNLIPSRKNVNLPEKFYPFPLPPPHKNCLTITEITSNNRTKSQPLPKNPNPSWKYINPPCTKKNCNPTWKFVDPPEYFSTPLKFLNPSWKFLNPPKISQPYRKNLNPSRKNLNPSRKFPNPSRKFLNPPPNFSTSLENIWTPLKKISNTKTMLTINPSRFSRG